MKRFLLLVISAIMACMAFVGCNKEEGPTAGYIPKKYDIEYKWKTDETGEEVAIPDLMWTPSGNYPTEYTEKTSTEISSLRNIRIDGDTIYVFEGWYYDLQYTQLVEDNTITKKSGNVTLYAKISEEDQAQGIIATITYKWFDLQMVDGDACSVLMEGMDTMPEAMVADLIFPTEYEEGVGTGLPRLKTWKQSSRCTYEFEDWYYDFEIENGKVRFKDEDKVIGDVIPNDKTGEIVLYAAIGIWIG